MKIVRPWTNDRSGNPARNTGRLDDGMQLEKVVDDFALAFRQREIATEGWREEQENFVQTMAAVTDALGNGPARWLSEIALLLAEGGKSATAASPAQTNRIRLGVLRSLQANEALMFWLQGRRRPPLNDEPELAPLIKEVVSFLRPYFTAAGSDLGISELCPGVHVSASSKAVGHILRNVLVDMLCQAPAANSYALAAVRDGESLLLTVSARSLQLGDARRWCLDSRSPGLRLAADIARDQALIRDLMPGAGTLARLELGVCLAGGG